MMDHAFRPNAMVPISCAICGNERRFHADAPPPPRPVPAPIGTLIDALELAAGRWGKRPTDELFHEACAARSALEAEWARQESALRHYGWTPERAKECVEGRTPSSEEHPMHTHECSAHEQIDKLAWFIMEEVPGEPSRSEGAVETAIRLLRAQFAPSARPETVSDHGTNDPHLEGEVPLSERAARPEPGAGREP